MQNKLQNKENQKEEKNESVELDEKSSLVAPVELIFDVIVKEIKKKMGSEYRRNSEKGLNFINSIAKIVGMKATDKKQQKNHLFLKWIMTH